MNQPSDTRFRVQKSLATVHGEEIAALCMELMPHIDTTLLVTRPDLDGAVVLLRRDMEHGFAAIRAEMQVGFAEQSRLFAETVARSTNRSLRWSIVTMVSMQAVLVAAVRLL